MLHGRRPPPPTVAAACRALSALIRLQSRLMDASDPAACLKNTWFPRNYIYLLRKIYHLNPGLLRLTRQKSKSGKETVNKQ